MPAHYAFWPKRLPYQLTAPQTSLWMNLQISALRYPQKVALVFMGRTWTYSQLQLEAEKIASALRKMGVQKGDRVVLDMQNCPQLVRCGRADALWHTAHVLLNLSPLRRSVSELGFLMIG